MKKSNLRPSKGRPKLPADERKSIMVPVKFDIVGITQNVVVNVFCHCLLHRCKATSSINDASVGEVTEKEADQAELHLHTF